MEIQTSSSTLEFFDPSREVGRSVRGHLPHWSQTGTVTFITWRTCDSLPAAVIEQWMIRRKTWLLDHGVDPKSDAIQSDISRLGAEKRRELQRILSTRWDSDLDACHGESPLRRNDMATIVCDSLKYFDGVRYELFDFVVMPNHVHLTASFATEETMREQCKSWKHYTAVRLNRKLGRRGHFWADDSFDHLIRSEDHFGCVRDYIAANPDKARLRAGEYAWYSRPLEGCDRSAARVQTNAAEPFEFDPFAERTEHVPPDPKR